MRDREIVIDPTYSLRVRGRGAGARRVLHSAIVLPTTRIGRSSASVCSSRLSTRSTTTPIGEQSEAIASELRTADRAFVSRRPLSSRWSAVEYGAHVNDVLRCWTRDIDRTAASDAPHVVPAVDPDERAAAAGYQESDPAEFARAITASVAALQAVAARVGEADGDRPCVVYRTHATAADLLGIALHEVHHHRRDIEANG
jgi:DinB superfamily